MARYEWRLRPAVDECVAWKTTPEIPQGRRRPVSKLRQARIARRWPAKRRPQSGWRQTAGVLLAIAQMIQTPPAGKRAPAGWLWSSGTSSLQPGRRWLPAQRLVQFRPHPPSSRKRSNSPRCPPSLLDYPRHEFKSSDGRRATSQGAPGRMGRQRLIWAARVA